MNQNQLYEPEPNTLQWQTFTVTLSTLLENGDFNKGCYRIQTPTLQLEQNTKQWEAFYSLPSKFFRK